MNKNVLWLVLVLAACGACAARQVTDSPTTSDPAIIKLLITDTSDGSSGHCTAWKVGENLIATAGHCCAPTHTFLTEGSHAVKGAAPIVLVDDDDNDVCVLRGAIQGDVIRLSDNDPALGEWVWTAGFPRGSFLISDGYWSGRDDNGGVVSVVVNPGASGSPLLNAKGESVGVMVRYKVGMDNLGYVATLEHLRAAVAKALRSK